MAGGNTIVVTDANFEQQISTGLSLVDFWAAWCAPCKAIAPKLEEIASELGDKIKILKMDVDNNGQAPAKYSIRAIPTLILFKDGKVVDQVMGNVPKEQLLSMISRHM